jgi:DNA-binding transcriptional ArsR family regulator
MAQAERPSETVVNDLLSVATLLEDSRLARVYTHILRVEEATVEMVVETLGMAQSTAYQDVNRLTELGLLTRFGDESPYHYSASPVQFSIESEAKTYTVTPTLIAALARSTQDEDLHIFLDRHGVGKLAAALEYAIPYANGKMSERIAARELDLHPVEGITALHALRDVIQEMQSVDPYFNEIGNAREENPA